MTGPALALSLAVVASPTARGPVCVQVSAVAADIEGLRALVASEVDRRSTHRAAAPGERCRSTLQVELVGVAGERYVTGRLGAHVPHRERVAEDRGLAAAVERVVTIVLHNDPIRLEGPAATALGGWVRTLRRRGHNLYGVEAFEVLGFAEGRGFALPGVAVRLRREAGETHIGVRLSYASRLGAGARRDSEPGVDLRDWASIALEAAWFLRRSADISPYLAGEAGLAIQRFGGPPRAVAGAEGAYEVVREELLLLGVRAGVEVLRTTDMRADLFCAAHLPVMPAGDELGVVDAWIPALSVGAGVAF